uniref:Uncharacterized protein n=1 Tax=Plectus sambesii TaxID=2011161 RepID=A0A914VCE3_9BILA
DVIVNKDTKEVKSAPYKVPLPSLSQIALGNNPLVADFSGTATSDGVKRSGPPDVTDAPAVIYQGSLVDVAQNLSQLRRMESEQKAMEQRNVALEKDLSKRSSN